MNDNRRGFALVVSRFNSEITDGLLRGALAYLQENNIHPAEQDVFYAPGAFEIPLIAQTVARTGRYRGVICLGAVIKGETAHFEFISLGATYGLMQASLEAGVPISFGILTSYTEEQARARSADDASNKGREAAAACLETANLLDRIARDKAPF
jgi:6,7-dimethyl-8-ribityllumazine synthase